MTTSPNDVGRVTSRGAGLGPRRLRRLNQVWIGDGYPQFFLTICTRDRQPVLANGSVQFRLREFLLGSPGRYGWWPTRYVLMPDHLHLLASGSPTASPLGLWIKALKAYVSQRRVRWQLGFFDHVIRSDESEAEKWEYIRQNPVRAGLVPKAEDWAFAGELNDPEGNAVSGDTAYNSRRTN